MTSSEINAVILYIRKTLADYAETDPEKKALFLKYIPGAQNPLVVSIPVLDDIIRTLWQQYKTSSLFLFTVCEQLWQTRIYYEDYKVAIRLLRKLVKKNPDKTMVLARNWSGDLHTWDLVDQLGMHCYGVCLASHFDTYIGIVQEWSRATQMWTRRLALSSLVRLRNTKLEKEQWQKVRDVLDTQWGDSEYYIKKGLSWVLRELSKSNEEYIIAYLKEKVNSNYPSHYRLRFLKESIKGLSSPAQKDLVKQFER